MGDFKLSKPTDLTPASCRISVHRELCPVCLGHQGGECERCNGSGYVLVADYAPSRALDAPSDDELELERLRAQLRRLSSPVCCPNCGTEIERSAA